MMSPFDARAFAGALLLSSLLVSRASAEDGPAPRPDNVVAQPASNTAAAKPESVAPSTAVGAGGAQADDPAGYRDAVEHALAELRLGHFNEARAMFLHAHELLPNARTLRGMGLAEFELRSYVDSIAHLQESLASTVRPLGPQLREETSVLLARASQYVTRLELKVLPSDAQVTMDGAPANLTPGLALLLAAGDHELAVSAPGHIAQRRKVHALGGDVQQFAVQLAAVRAPLAREAKPALIKNPWLWVGVGTLVAGASVTAGVLATRNSGESGQPYRGTTNTSIPGP